MISCMVRCVEGSEWVSEMLCVCFRTKMASTRRCGRHEVLMKSLCEHIHTYVVCMFSFEDRINIGRRPSLM